MKITVLCNDPENWFVPYGADLISKLTSHETKLIYNHNEIEKSDICFILSYTKLIPEEILCLSDRNIVVHASDLPKGRGFSPLQWQVLRGLDEIALSMFEVNQEIDAGKIYMKKSLKFEGHELLSELRHKMGLLIVDMCVEIVAKINEIVPFEQTGEPSYFRRRTIEDDRIDINKSIVEQFNHFRIADNENYPLYFDYLGHRYLIAIKKINM